MDSVVDTPAVRHLKAELALIAAAGVVLTLAATAITARSVSGEGAALAGVARASMVAVPIAVGVYAWRRRPTEAFGRLLVAAGFAWFLTTLAESSTEVLYSVGRVAGWFVELGLVWLLLAYPSGRLTTRIDRGLVWAAVGLVALLYLPSALVTEHFPVPTTYSTCDGGCPGNAFSIVGSEPAFVESVLVPLRQALTVLLYLAVTARLVQRVRGATRLMRLTFGALVVVACARAVVLVLAVAIRELAPDSQMIDVLLWTLALAVPAFAVAFLVGFLQRRLHEAGALERLGGQARGGLSRKELERVLADVVGDPDLQVVYPSEDSGRHWLDAQGEPVEVPRPGSHQCLTEVREGGRLVAGVKHHEALRDDADFVRTAASYALVAVDNRRLAARVEASLVEVRESRTRILASGDRERRRIERDLHDGAQQHLVALGIQLELAEELIRSDPERGLAKLHALGGEVGKTLEEIQHLARGVYPSLLADRGLGEALRAAAMRLPMAATVDPDGLVRYPPEVENAVYFCCLEAMNNAAKHAGASAVVTVVLGQRDGLVFEVRDTGTGFDRSIGSPGAGLTNMRDRLAALGGEVEVRSRPGEGTIVTGKVPLA